jgi:NADH-quinone oxidoreductase subunit M
MPDGAILLLLCVLPAVGALGIALLSQPDSGRPRLAALLVMLAVLALATGLFLAGDGEVNLSRPELNLPWIPSMGVNFHLAVDGLNAYLLLLTGLLFPVVLGCCWRTTVARSRLFLVMILLLQSGLLGTFLAQNLMLFFVCWEAVLIPMFILILVFGGKQSRQAAQTFFLYTLAGSVLLLAAVILLGAECLQQTGNWSFEFDNLMRLHLDRGTQFFIFAAVVLACAIKCPLFPFHSWLPLAYAEAPPAGTALMAGALSKMGAFGLLKLAIPLCPQATVALAPGMLLLAVVSILYGAVLALRQEDFKKLVAYSSLSHMGYIVLGVFSFHEIALHGAMFQMLSHGVAVAGLFLLLGLLEERLGDPWRQVSALATSAPRLAVVLMLFVLTSIALPLTSGFTSEFLVLFGAFQQGMAAWRADAGALSLVAVLLASSGMVLGAGYMLRFARRILFGQAGGGEGCRDLGLREVLAFVPLLLLIFWVGIWPASFMGKTQDAVTALAARAAEAAGPPPAPVLITQTDGGNHGQ